jgi:hypothetical protein
MSSSYRSPASPSSARSGAPVPSRRRSPPPSREQCFGLGAGVVRTMDVSRLGQSWISWWAGGCALARPGLQLSNFPVGTNISNP